MSAYRTSRAARPLRARRAGTPLALVLLALAPAGAALGAWTWETVPTVTAEASYETNPDNVADQTNVSKDDAYIGSLGLNVRVNGVAGTSRAYLEPQVRFRESWANESTQQLDGTDVIFPASLTWYGERSQTVLQAGYSLLPSRDADYQVVNPNEPLPPGGVGCNVDTSGRCRIEENQQRWYIGPDYLLNISPRLQLNLNAEYSSTTYDEAEFTGRFDYDYFYGTASLIRAVKPRHRINVDLNASQYTAELPGSTIENDTTTIGFSVGYEYTFSEQTSLNVAAGSSLSDLKFSGRPSSGGLPCFDPGLDDFVTCETTGEDTNFTGQLFLRQRVDEKIAAQIGISRELQPNADGAQVVVDTINGFISRDITGRLRGTAGASYISQEAVGARSEGILRQRFDRNYWRLELGMDYRLGERWTVRGEYNYYLDQQKAALTSGEASSKLDIDNNIVAVSMRYEFQGFR